MSVAGRILEPELLDHLPATDERARHTRRDLRKLNWLMGHPRLMAGMMRDARFDTLIDLGSGDGHFANAVVRKLNRPCELVLVDRQQVLASDKLIVADVIDFLRQLTPQSPTAIMANLFLHHLSDHALRELFDQIARKVDCFFACEPRRARASLAAVRLLPLIGCNAVTRHDAVVSIRAGFVRDELTALWPDTAPPWRLSEFEGGYASHCFIAVRA